MGVKIDGWDSDGKIKIMTERVVQGYYYYDVQGAKALFDLMHLFITLKQQFIIVFTKVSHKDDDLKFHFSNLLFYLLKIIIRSNQLKSVLN